MARAEELEMEIRGQGEEIFRSMGSESKNIFHRDWWYGQVMDWSMKNVRFKTQMFRFVDVLPTLASSQEVTRHIREYFQKDGELPPIMNVGLGVGALAPGLVAGTIRKNVTQMAKMFITGESPQEALPTLKKARDQGIAFTMDLLGEATLSEVEAQEYQHRYLEMINWLGESSSSWPTVESIDRGHDGTLLPKVNVSVKLSSLYSQINLKAWEATKSILKERMRPLFRATVAQRTFLNVDMENYDLKDLTLEVFKEMISESEFQNYPYFGIVIQAYLRDSLADIDDLVSFAKTRKVPFTVRLVKGAYWDYETIVASQRHWSIPVYTNKQESDANFESCAKVLLAAFPHIHVALASHNVRSLSAALVEARRLKVDPKGFEIQMLYGMAEGIKKAFVKLGYRVREYAPVGEMLPGMAYLVRRLLENTSNESFLRSKYVEGVSADELLKDPRHNLVPSSAHWPQSDRFENEPLVDFKVKVQRDSMKEALNQVRRENQGKKWPLVLNGKAILNGRFIESRNPSSPQEVLAQVAVAGTAEAEMALKMARDGFRKWCRVSVNERARVIEKVADLIQRDRMKLSALAVLETGKSWSEADGDVAEAIDFCRYYAVEMKRLGKPLKMGSVLGETSLYQYRGRGVAVVISPWNFPLAIMTGMAAAALVAGNSVILKPAEQSSVMGAYLMELLREAGVPSEAVHFLPGYGEEVGDYLIRHKGVDIIAFTGSREVGLHILKCASEVKEGQLNVKKVIIEMGGKNAIIVDSDADLDEAILGVVYSAFGFQGQKCSACSRVIVLEEVYDRFVTRLIEATRSIKLGAAENPDSYLGPVIDEEAFKKIRTTIEGAKARGCRLLYEGEAPAGGYFVAPTIFGDVASNDPLAQEEIFGPVLAVLRAQNLDHAIEMGNGTQYGLTGGLYSRSPSHIERVKEEFEVGNLYINRGITGALVERHPFGGFKMSGIGSKTGGPDYLLQYLEPRCVIENTMRRGFAPTTEES